MPALNFLPKWFRRLLRRPAPYGSRRWRNVALPPHPYRPVLETLEDRLPPGNLMTGSLAAPDYSGVEALTAFPDDGFWISDPHTGGAPVPSTGGDALPTSEGTGDPSAGTNYTASSPGTGGNLGGGTTSDGQTGMTEDDITGDVAVFFPSGGTGPTDFPGGPAEPPSVGFLTISGVSEDRGVSSHDFHTSDTSLRISGTGSPGVSFSVRVDGTAVASGQVAADGAWAANLPILSEGPHQVEAVTAEGDSTAAVNVVIDTTAPELTLEGPAYLNRYWAEFTVTASDDRGLAGAIAIDIDRNGDGDYDDQDERDLATGLAGPGESRIMVGPLPEGNYDLRARAVDRAGNVGASELFQVSVAMDLSGFGPHGHAPGDNDPVPTPGGGVVGGASALPGPAEDDEGDDEDGGRVILRDTFANEVEPNDTSATANVLTFNPNEPHIVSGTIASGADVDFFQLTLASRSGVFFDIDSRETGLSTTLNSVLTLFDSSGSTTLDSNDDGYDFDTGLPAQQTTVSATTADSALYRDLDPGDYFIRVSSTGSTAGDYELRILADTNYSSTPPVLNSNPSAPATIFLDLDGHSSSTDAWVQANNNQAYNVEGYDNNNNQGEFTPGEQLAIRNLWRAISEDFSPFNINVTTSYNGPFDDGVAMRVVFADNDGSAVGINGALGVAFVDSFAARGPDDNVCWVFRPVFSAFNLAGGSSATIMALPILETDTTSHEVGHTLGLLHYGGTNSQPEGIMEAALNGLARRLWRIGLTHSGEDPQPPITQDDMAIISNTTNGFGYRADDHGDTPGAATVLTATGRVYSATGVISVVASDIDYFRFRATAGGPTTISVQVDDYLNDLDVEVRLLDASGAVVAADDPGNSFDGSLSVDLAETDFFLEVRSDREPGEGGQYTVEITVPTDPPPPPPPPPPPGPGGPGGPSMPPDPLEPNDTSDRALNRGTLSGQQGISDLTIGRTPQGLPDYDWFRWTAGAAGAVTASIDITEGGDLELRVYTLAGNTMVLVGSSANPGADSQSVAANFAAGQVILVEVKGRNSAPGVMDQGRYDLTMSM